MAAQLFVAFVAIAFDRRILDGAVHALDLAVGPQALRTDPMRRGLMAH